MKIATWNVNSLKQRLEHLLRFLKDAEPDAVCLQELKCQDDSFPHMEIEAAGYHAVVHGQKAYNGVAILSRVPLENVKKSLPGNDADEQSRYIEGILSDGSQTMRVASLYLPNGNPLGTEKFPYKLAWLDRLAAHATTLMRNEEAFVLAGDYNVIPEPRDASDPAAWINDALFQPITRAKFRTLLDLGLTDALRACTDASGLYTFWDYQAGAWQRNFGIRIDHILASPQAADRLTGVRILKDMRSWEKPSDHVPVMAEFGQ